MERQVCLSSAGFCCDLVVERSGLVQVYLCGRGQSCRFQGEEAV